MAARLVYSSGGSGDDGRDDRRGDGGKRSTDPDVSVLEPAEHRIRVSRQRAGRRGKTVTIVAPIRRSRSDAAEMLRELKKRCGAGGALKPGDAEPAHWVLELQGDRVEAVLDWLDQRGFEAKRSGG